MRGFAHAVLAAALLLAAFACEGSPATVTQAVVWLPTGLAIAGLWILGPRSVWAIAAAVFAHRVIAGFPVPLSLSAAFGSSCEALLGLWVLRRLRLDPSFARLRDVLVLFTAALVAPLASVLVSAATHLVRDDYLRAPFYSGWPGWWRMNVLGVLALVPPLLAWHARRPTRLTPRALFELVALSLGTLMLVLGVMELAPPGIESILSLYALMLLSLVVALRFEPIGAILHASVAALLVLGLAAYRGGVFLDIPLAQRHVAMQIVGLSLLCIPLVIGSLIAERRARDRGEERQLAFQATILELVACGRAKDVVFEGIVTGIEALLPGSRCSILLLEGRRLRVACAPSLPPGYSAALDGLEIGPDIGCCGAAAHRGARVIAVDVEHEPSWVRFRELARHHGLRSCWSQPVRDASGSILGTFSLYHGEPHAPEAFELALVERAAALAGITLERERREDQLQRARKLEALGKLAGGVAHDFNNLLTGILGFAESLRHELGPQSPLTGEADEIVRAARRGAGLTRQLLTFSRQQPQQARVLDLGDVVEELVGMLQRLIGEDVRLLHGRAGGRVCVRVDRGQIEQVLMNLVLNARDAMPHGGTLTIRTARAELGPSEVLANPELAPGSYAVLSVQDTGVGMSEEVRAHAFDPFFTTKDPGKGTGIGLSTVYGIVKQAGGAVWIESAPGMGTTVWIHLCRVEEEPAHDTAVLVPHAPTRSATILLAEDETVVRDFVRQTLIRAGHTVLEAEDGQVALAIARVARTPIDLVVTDVVMPRMGGPELVAALRARGDLPVLFLSGYARDQRRSLEATPPPVSFLAKPFTSAELQAAVSSLLARTPQPPRAPLAPAIAEASGPA